MTEYRIDDLAHASATTTRNIRGYQERGLLPRPLRRGRTAIYNDRHLHRLRAINRLLAEGFTLKHITRFLTGLQQDAKLADVLNLTDLLEQRWSSATETVLTLTELQKRLGPVRPEDLTALIDAELIRPDDAEPDTFTILDTETVSNFESLIARGMTLGTLAEVHRKMSEQLKEAARVLVSAAHEEVARQRGPGWMPKTDKEFSWAADLVATMRGVATHSAHATMNRALDDALKNELKLYQERAEQQP